jgi:hypothetical protein
MEGNEEEHIRLKKEADDGQTFGSWGFSTQACHLLPITISLSLSLP